MHVIYALAIFKFNDSFPFDGLGIVKERVDNLMKLQLDNSDAFEPDPVVGLPSSILKGPMFHEMKRLRDLAPAPKPRL